MAGVESYQELSERRRREARQRNDAFNQPLSVADEALIDILAALPRARVSRLVNEAAKLRRRRTSEHPTPDSDPMP